MKPVQRNPVILLLANTVFLMSLAGCNAANPGRIPANTASNVSYTTDCERLHILYRQAKRDLLRRDEVYRVVGNRVVKLDPVVVAAEARRRDCPGF